MDKKKAVERLKNQYDRQNNFVREKYDRISLTLPKGTKDRIKAVSGESVNAWIFSLIDKELKRLEKKKTE